jgi:hypothetical protein
MTPEDVAALRAAEEIELVTTGRRTGRPHSVTLWSAYEDGALWLRADSDADWYRNLLADPRCRVRFDGREVDGRYEPLVKDERSAAGDEQSADDPESLRRLIGLWRVKYGNEWVGDWYVERGRIPVRVRIANSA